MTEIKEIRLSQTSSNTSDIPDVILTSPNSQNLKTRQILRSRIINNARMPENSLSIDLIHEKKGDDGTWNSSYQDLRKLKEGESVRIQLDSSQTKQLHENLGIHQKASEGGVGNGKRYIISGVSDIANIAIADTANKKALAEKILAEISEKDASDIILSNKKFMTAFFSSLPQIKIEVLENLKRQLETKLSGNEMTVQNWIDENRKIRCLVFGLEFVDYKREVSFGNSRFDLLMEQTGEYHVIIELKSPSAELFDVVIKKTTHGEKAEYIISKDLAEAIPQIIKNFGEYERENEVTFKKNGVKKKEVSKGIIVIGRSKKDDPIWQEYYNNLCHRLSGIEILTYDHLLSKISNQITNLINLSNDCATIKT
jgi:hypothetical protein